MKNLKDNPNKQPLYVRILQSNKESSSALGRVLRICVKLELCDKEYAKRHIDQVTGAMYRSEGPWFSSRIERHGY